MISSRRLLAGLACATVCAVAHADRSRLDEPDDVVERGDCEFEVAAERQTARDAPRARESSIQLGCGIGWRTELIATVARRRGEAREEGFDIVAKTSLGTLGTQGAGAIGWTIEYGASTERTGSERWRRSEYFIAIDAALRPSEAWVIEALLGSARDRIERRDRTLWELAVEHELGDALEARVELAGDDRRRPLASVELRYEFWRDVARLSLSFGARAGPQHERRGGIGITFEF